MRSISTAFVQACARLTFSCNSMASAIWLPMVSTGLSDVIGSWNTIAMSLPRTARIASSSSASKSMPASLTEPPAIRPGGSGTSRIRDNAVMLLPQPDSPTMASVSCGASEKLTPSTALTTP